MEKWLSLLIKPDQTIFETMKLINDTASQFAVVVNDRSQILGTVTDGDIRRGILSGIAIDDAVERIMNRNPVYVTTDDSEYKIMSIFHKKRLRQIPVVDHKKRVVNIYFADDLLNLKQKDNLVILMAGGLGTRLQPLTNDVPKPMLKVGSKPILETIIENFIEQGFYRFLLSVNYKKDMIMDYFGDGAKWGISIDYIIEEKRLGTAGALSLLPEPPEMPFIVMNGDILTKINFRKLLEFHEDSKGIATLSVREYEVQIPYGVIETEGYKLTNIIEKPKQRFFVNAGIYVLDPGVIQYVPKNTYYDMPALFTSLISHQQTTNVYPIKEYWIDIGQLGDYERAKVEFSEVFK